MEKKPAGICIIEAPCKINLHLRIGERRPDGFHSLESLFASVAFSDTLQFEFSEREGESLLSTNWEVPWQEISEENNLVLRAISLFRERTSFKRGLHVHLDKRIPVGAGLGGGSSDAASTLLAMNLLSEAALSASELNEMASSLGSDVPFFLTGGTAFVSGRGELVEPAKSPQGLWVVLVKPSFSSDTASAFRLLDLVRKQGACEEKVEFREALPKEALIRALEGESGAWPFYNDFLTVFLRSGSLNWENPDQDYKTKAGAYRAILESLRDFGASFTGLSGAGSCCFGVFGAKGEAERAAEKLPESGNFVRLTFFLAHKANPVLK